MGKLLNHLFGRLMPDTTSRRDEPADATPPRQIEGARAARQLCMLPMDANLPSGREMEIVRAHANPAPRIVQFKPDGIRALYIDGRIVSREGAPLDCALHCQPGLQRLEEAAGLGPLMIDGEYVAEDGFSATLAEHKRGQGDGVFWAFDMMPLADWQRGGCATPIENRLGVLKRSFTQHCNSLFVGALDHWVLDPQDTIAKAREIWAAGGEGIVSKRLGSPYIRDRSEDWLRVKETHTVDGAVVDLMARGDGTLKSMVVKVPSEPRVPVIVGTGWTASEGRALLAMHAGALTDEAMWVEISFQLSTGATRAIRGARFHRVRASKGVGA